MQLAEYIVRGAMNCVEGCRIFKDNKELGLSHIACTKKEIQAVAALNDSLMTAIMRAVLLLASRCHLHFQVPTSKVQPSSAVPVKSMRKFLRRIFGTKPPKDPARPLNLGSIDPGPGNDPGSTEPTASSKFIRPTFALLTTARPCRRRQCHLETECVQPWTPSS